MRARTRTPPVRRPLHKSPHDDLCLGKDRVRVMVGLGLGTTHNSASSSMRSIGASASL